MFVDRSVPCCTWLNIIRNSSLGFFTAMIWFSSLAFFLRVRCDGKRLESVVSVLSHNPGAVDCYSSQFLACSNLAFRRCRVTEASLGRRHFPGRVTTLLEIRAGRKGREQPHR